MFYNDNCDRLAADETAYLAGEPIEMPELPVVRPPVAGIRVPRSAKRQYTEGELRAAACMMDKLRRRDDLRAMGTAGPPRVSGSWAGASPGRWRTSPVWTAPP